MIIGDIRNALLSSTCNKVLLQKKARGLFGEDRWNAPRGKMLNEESPEKAAVREMLEETGLEPTP